MSEKTLLPDDDLFDPEKELGLFIRKVEMVAHESATAVFSVGADQLVEPTDFVEKFDKELDQREKTLYQALMGILSAAQDFDHLKHEIASFYNVDVSVVTNEYLVEKLKKGEKDFFAFLQSYETECGITMKSDSAEYRQDINKRLQEIKRP